MIAKDFIFFLYFGLFLNANLNHAMWTATNGGYNDASLVTWAHAVNSHQALEAELEGLINFLEADVSLGHVSGNEDGPLIPIMAHPPDVISDISLERWLDTVIIRESGKGIKLDFKSIETVEPSLKILQKHKGKLVFPLWLNADILPGPVSFHTKPVPAEKFLTLCKEYFPNATLSVGWTTYWLPSFPEKSWCYSWDHVREMVETVKHFHDQGSPLITFPVRGIFASRSISQMKWLLEIFPEATLTVWSGRYDVLELEDLKKIRETFPKWRVYYDVPEKIGNRFRKLKDDLVMKRPPKPTFTDQNYVKIARGQDSESCSSKTYITSRTVMFGKQCETVVFLKERLVVTEETPLKMQGEVTFVGNESLSEDPYVILALAEAKYFSKDVEDGRSGSDTDTVWSALNSSQLHVFRHVKSSESTGCHLFQLDTGAKNPFQAWTVDCDQMKKDRTIAIYNGKSEVSSRKRLVLPTGPLVFGMISLSEGYVVIDNIDLEGRKSGSEPCARSPKYFEIMFLCVALACLTLLYFISVDECLGFIF